MRALPFRLNRTTGRLVILRAAVRSLGLVSPRAAGALAARLWATPARARGQALDAHRFTVDTPWGPVVAWDRGEGPTVILSHGWSSSAARLAPLFHALVAAGFHTVAFDHVGHGESPGSEGNVVRMADAVAAVARRVGPVHALVGHSLGGAAVLRALALLGTQANQAVLIAAPSQPTPFALKFAALLGLNAATQAAFLAALERRIGHSLAALDVAPLKSPPPVPVTIFHDQQDREVEPWHGEAIAAAWPTAQLVRTHGLGHNRILKDPSTLQAVLRELGGGRAEATPSRRPSRGQSQARPPLPARDAEAGYPR